MEGWTETGVEWVEWVEGRVRVDGVVGVGEGGGEEGAAEGWGTGDWGAGEAAADCAEA